MIFFFHMVRYGKSLLLVFLDAFSQTCPYWRPKLKMLKFLPNAVPFMPASAIAQGDSNARPNWK